MIRIKNVTKDYGSNKGVFVVRQDFADVRILTEGIRELSEAGMEFAGCILNQTEHK